MQGGGGPGAGLSEAAAGALAEVGCSASVERLGDWRGYEQKSGVGRTLRSLAELRVADWTHDGNGKLWVGLRLLFEAC